MAEGTSHSADELLATAERRKRVLELRKEGHDLRTIAARLEDECGAVALPNGWDSRYVSKDIHRALQKVRSDVDADARDVLRLELRRLDALQAAVFSDALNGDLKAFDRVLKAMKRRAKYLGLDEPEQIDAALSLERSEEFQDVLSDLMDALEGFPEARMAVARALADDESDDAGK